MPANLGFALTFAGQDLLALPSGGLWWPRESTLAVADLHLGRSERYARRGGALLPPWETHDTLAKLDADIARFAPQRVISLGDSFDDDAALAAITSETRDTLARMAEGREWIWLSGNHDGAAKHGLSGSSHEIWHGALTFRHIAAEGPDISGHYHPATRFAGRLWRVFGLGRNHLILPAYGLYTGGLSISDPALRPLLQGGIAITCGDRMFALPIDQVTGPRADPSARQRKWQR